MGTFSKLRSLLLITTLLWFGCSSNVYQMKYRDDLIMLGFTPGAFNHWEHDKLPLSLDLNRKSGKIKVYVVHNDYHSNLREEVILVRPSMVEPKIHQGITTLNSIDELIEFLKYIK